MNINQTDQSFIQRFLKLESSAGILLMMSAALAIFLANTPFNLYYNAVLMLPVEVKVGAIEIAKPLLLWINDGMMAIFFLLVGLELKRELIEGQLSDRRKIVVPAVGAVGGMIVPALIYVWFNWNDPIALKGWAIPAATDIAFALGILALLGSRVPVSLKIFLTSLAIFDDIGAIIIIALFYTSKISIAALLACVLFSLILFILNRRGSYSTSAYMFIGVLMWVAMLKSGVHATLAGIILAIFIPIREKDNPESSPLKDLEHDLHSLVAFFILPVFAFANSGVNFSGVTLDSLMHGVPTGIAAGLFIGKQVGIFGLIWLAVKFARVQLPEGMNMLSLYGTAALCGVGYTMSLFIGSLAFEETGVNLLFDERLGIIIGSLLSGIVGYLVLNAALPKEQTK